jgi:hypothetical protein
VVAPAGSILDAQLGGVGEGLTQELLEPFHRHAPMLAGRDELPSCNS